MDEVDKIIIDTLRALNCNIPEDVTSLKFFNDEFVILSVSTCLEVIIPHSKFPKKLSPSMAVKLKTASHLAEQIKDIGFKEEIGYQTILYFNEVEIRRLLIFLIEKLPRDSNGSAQTEEVGYIPKLLAILKRKLSNVPELWIPSSLLCRGCYVKDEVLQFRSYGNSCNLKTKNLRVPTSEDNINYKYYNIHILPTVTKQCALHQLIPSLFFEDSKFSRKNKDMLSYLRSIPLIGRSEEVLIEPIIEKPVSKTEKKLTNHTPDNRLSTEQVLIEKESTHSIMEDLEIQEEKYIKLKKTLEEKKLHLSKLSQTREEEMKVFEDATNKFNIKTKTMAVLSQEENLHKLTLLIEKANKRIVQLANQWNEVKGPLLTEYQDLQSCLSEKESCVQEKESKLKIAMANYEEMLSDLKEKVVQEQKLVERHKQCPKNTNRSTYTKNIMEIIGNIKKQNYEMQKILKDTRAVQKDINTLTGQIDRSFTISDELIFSNAKKDEMSRNAYKLLVSLHNECGEIVKIVSDIGFIERECRNLQELIDIETTKETSVKLRRLNEDLQQIKDENIQLIKQVQ